MSSEHGKVVGRGKTSIENITGTLRGPLLPGLREHWGIIFITLLAATFRFAFFDLTQYDFDHSYPAFQALQILEEGRFPTTSLLNPLGLPNPPLMAYIQALPLFFVRSPLAVQVTITLLNLLAVPLTYSLGLRLFDKKTALAAAFLLAITPWGVYFSRASWVQGLLPFFTALIAYLLFPALVEEKPGRRRIFLGLATAALMAQTYLLAYAAIAQVALVLLAFRRQVSWRPILAGLLFSLIVSLPYTYAILSQGEKALSDADYLFPRSPVVDTEALIHATLLVTGADYPLSTAYAPDYSWRAFLFQIAGLGLTVLLILGIGEGVLRLLKRGPPKNHLLLLLWFFTPIALLTVHTVGVVHYYLLLTYPAGFVLAGLGARHLWRLRSGALVLALALILLFAERITLTHQARALYPGVGYIEWLPTPYSVIRGIEGLPLRYSLSLGQAVRETTREVYVKAPQEWISAVSGTLVKPYDDFDESQFLVLRANRPALYILLDPKQLSPAFSFAQELQDKKIDLPNNGSIRFFLFPQRSTQELASLPSNTLDLQLDIDWRLLGYNLPDSAHSEDTVAFTTYWLIEELPPNRHSLFLKPFVHLQNAEGKTVAQNDGHGQAGYLWRRGDLYIDTSYIPLPADLPPGEYWIYTGLYNPSTSTRALFPNGQDHILIGPLRIE